MNFLKNKIITFLCLASAVVMFTGGCFRNTPRADGKRYEFYVTRVIDGDTIVLSNGRHVRYIGMDTPEIRKKIAGEWVYDPEPFALLAKEFNKELIEGKRVTLEFDMEKEDKYGRWLAYVYTDKGVMVNSLILEKGLGKLLTIPPDTKKYRILKNAEDIAKRKKRGLWKTFGDS